MKEIGGGGGRCGQVPMRKLRQGAKDAFLRATERRLHTNGAPNVRIFDVLHAEGRLDGGLRVNMRRFCRAREYLYVVPSFALDRTGTGGRALRENMVQARTHRISAASLDRARNVLSLFRGEHDFGVRPRTTYRTPQTASPARAACPFLPCAKNLGRRGLIREFPNRVTLAFGRRPSLSLGFARSTKLNPTGHAAKSSLANLSKSAW